MFRLSTFATIVVAIVVAGCGGASNPSPSASSGSPQKGPTIKDAYAFSACMRDHGVSNFPDPQQSSQGGTQKISIAINPTIASSPAFKTAQQRCGHILPMPSAPSPSQVKAQTAEYVAFADCMRTHGFSSFPDPNAQGQLTLAALQKAGINVQQPALEPTADRCTSVTHGAITKANVTQAIAELSGSGSSTAAAG